MFAVVGEALVDLVGQRGGQTFVAHPGGSPANVALGLARLGVPVTLSTRLGRDAFGQLITAHLEASGVTVDPGPEPRGNTSLAIATLAAGVASYDSVSYTHLRAHETVLDLVCRLLLEKKKTKTTT